MCKCMIVLGRIVIGILSVLFAVLGFVLMVFGIMVKVNAAAIKQMFQPLLDSAKSQATSAAGQSIDLPTDNFNIAELVGGLATAFIIIGLVMVILGVLGVAGACCKVKCMIILYLIIVGVLLVSQIILVIIIVADRPVVTDPPKAGLKTSLEAEYEGVNGTSATSLMWNVIMNGLQCCGIDGGDDFKTAEVWQTTWGAKSTRAVPFVVPAACCKTGALTQTDQFCAEAPTEANSNKDIGCYDTVWDFILNGTPFIIFVCADIGGLGLLTLFAAVILYDIMKKSRVGTLV